MKIKLGPIIICIHDEHVERHDPIRSIHQELPVFTKGDGTMSAGFTLPFDEIATVKLAATRKSGASAPVPDGSTVTSDNAAVLIVLDPSLTFYTATATAQAGTANISFAPPPGSPIPVDIAVCTIGAAVADPITALSQDTAGATFAPNPAPPTA